MSREDITIGSFGGWDNSHAPEDFDMFGETLNQTVNENDDEDEIITKIDKDDLEIPVKGVKPEAKEVKKAKEQEEIETALFSDWDKDTDEEETEESEEEEEVEDKGKKSNTVKISSKQSLEFLKEKGFVEYELEEGTELTDELAEEILEDSLDERAEAKVDKALKALPESIKNLVKVAIAGGNINSVLSQLSKAATSGIHKDTDMTAEANQVLAITEDLKDQGYDAEEIDTHIEFLKSSGKLEVTSKKAFDRRIAKQTEIQTAAVQKAKEAKEAQKESQRQYKSGLTSHVTAIDNVFGLAISKKDKEELPAYIAEASIELENGNKITPMQKMMIEIWKDKDKTIALAKIFKNNFDLSSIERAAVTKQSRGIKANLENTNGSKGGSQATISKRSQKPLAERF